MFEDIYRIYTGEPLEPEKGMIPVECLADDERD
jgi:hypothetical protein